MINAKLAAKPHPHHQTTVKISQTVAFGGKEVVIIGDLAQLKAPNKWKLSPKSYLLHQ